MFIKELNLNRDMLLTATTDKVEVIIGATGVNPLHMVSSYNDTTSTSVTPTKTVTIIGGATGSTGPVNLMPAPASGRQRSLRYASIFNSDTVSATVTVRTNYNGSIRNAISTVLQVNEYLQYTYRTGWKAFDVNGAIKVQNNFNSMTDIRAQELFLTATSTAATTYGTPNTYCTYLGKATGPYTYILVNYVVTTAISGTVSWAEMSIYKGKPSLGTGTTLTRLGWIDCATNWLQSGQNRWTTIPVGGTAGATGAIVSAGDDIWLVVGVNTTTASVPTFRSADVADNIGAGFIQTAGNNRPSTSPTLVGTISTTQTGMQSFWNGI